MSVISLITLNRLMDRNDSNLSSTKLVFAVAASAFGQCITLDLMPVKQLPQCETDNRQKQGQTRYTCPSMLENGFEPRTLFHHQNFQPMFHLQHSGLTPNFFLNAAKPK
ncbi:hypothetical protein [Rhodoferax sp.]|uniref:hypothetical protein n=1 Tax=Rhodoferax sp. TaxID=50421 RepID=UPI00261C556D|nr:hypothetical protein [Rhodoferax sp.]MDD2923972.1 hypothetical protein [Rhodoferax sp.]